MKALFQSPNSSARSRRIRQRKENMSTNATMSESGNQRLEHKVVSSTEWLAARKKLLEAEKGLTRRSDDQREATLEHSSLLSNCDAGPRQGSSVRVALLSQR